MIVMLAVLYLSLRLGSSSLNQPSSPSSFTSTFSCADNGLSLSLEGTLENLERLLYHVAKGKGVSPTTILNRLGRKVKGRQRMNKNRNRNSLQDMERNGILNKVPVPGPIPMPIPGRDILPLEFRDESMEISSFLPTRGRTTPAEAPRSYPFQTIKSPHMIHSLAPAPLFIPMQSFKPPPGVTVKVNSGGIETKLPDVTVTLSPMMTVAEALRQADAKFKEVLGIPDTEDDVIAFSFSPFSRCIVVNRFNNVGATDFFAWKLIIMDIQGQIVYDDVCLPNEKTVPIKPGTTISLSYTSL